MTKMMGSWARHQPNVGSYSILDSTVDGRTQTRMIWVCSSPYYSLAIFMADVCEYEEMGQITLWHAEFLTKHGRQFSQNVMQSGEFCSLHNVLALCTNTRSRDQWLLALATMEQCEFGHLNALSEITALTQIQCFFSELYVKKENTKIVGIPLGVEHLGIPQVHATCLHITPVDFLPGKFYSAGNPSEFSETGLTHFHKEMNENYVK